MSVSAEKPLAVDTLLPMKLALKVRFDTPINIGGHGAPVFVDRPFRRDRDGWPFIPASSLRGRLRHECSRVLQSLGQPACNHVRADDLCREAGSACAICALFGAPWLRSRLRPEDLHLVRPPGLREEAPSSRVRYNVSLSRSRRVAEEARLFTTELFLPGILLEFTGEWQAHLTLKDLALIEAGFGAMTALGRGKTGGLGWCQIMLETEVKDAAQWRVLTEAERAAGRAAW